MANLIIQENGVERGVPAYHGELLTIEAPCDCSAVTGVQIAGVVYPFYDALGTDLSASTDLFSSGSLIRVLIDTVHTRATIVNSAITAQTLGAYSMKDAIPLEAGTDLNTLTTVGQNYVASSSVTSSLINSPTTSGFMLHVERNANSTSNYCTQRLVTYHNEVEWIRKCNNGTWSEWGRVYTTANKPTLTDVGAMGYKRLLTSSDDMDTLYEEGIYRADSGSLPANFPLTVSGIVEIINTATVDRDNPTYGVEQRVTRYGASGTTFSRTKSGGAWHEWAKDYNSQNKPALTELSGTLPVANGGTGATTFTSGAALIGAGTGAVTTRAITNNTAATTAITASTNLVTMNTLRYAMNRTTGVVSNDTNYSTYMVRGIGAGTADMTAGTSSLASGAIYLVYE